MFTLALQLFSFVNNSTMRRNVWHGFIRYITLVKYSVLPIEVVKRRISESSFDLDAIAVDSWWFDLMLRLQQ